MQSISVVIPCLNEFKAIPAVLERTKKARQALVDHGIEKFEIIVVDDGSHDGSPQLLATDPDVVLIRSPKTQGYGAALKLGFAAAKSDLIAFYDMDHTYDPYDLIPMLQQVRSHKADIVCGDRLSRCGEMPLTRQIGNNLFVSTINLLYRNKVYDSCTGLRLFKKELKPHFCNLRIDNLNFSLAMTLFCLSRGIRSVEMPINYDKRIGKSKLNVLVDGPRFFMTIIWFWLRFEWSKRAQIHTVPRYETPDPKS